MQGTKACSRQVRTCQACNTQGTHASSRMHACDVQPAGQELAVQGGCECDVMGGCEVADRFRSHACTAPGKTNC